MSSTEQERVKEKQQYDFFSRKKILQRVVERKTHILVDILKERLTEFERELLELVMPRYTQGCRWYDPFHIPYSALFLINLCQKEKLDRSVLLPALLLHDVGYSALITDKNKNAEKVKAGTVSADDRIAHMKAGVQVTAELFAELRKRGFINETSVEKAVQDIVATHDNPYIGIPLETPLEEQHRDADRIFVMSFVSFVKDYLRYLEEGKEITQQTFLVERLTTFSKPSGFSGAYTVGIQLTPEMGEKHKNRFEPLQYRYSVAVNQEQFKMRLAEIKGGLFDCSLEDFEESCKLYIDKELEFVTEEIKKL